MKVKLFDNGYSDFQNQKFLDQWKRLYIECPWGTPFQSPEFVTTWFNSYKSMYSPIIIGLENNEHILVGLLILALQKNSNQLVVAGAHQAEYQCWLASPDCPDDFLIRALVALDNAKLRAETLRFKYLPKNALTQPLLESKRYLKVVKLVNHQRPLMAINGENIEKSFRKKSNKSRFNRLKKLGELRFRKILDTSCFENTFDRIIKFYDLRQGAINNSFPFLDDPQKKDFHLKLLKNHPDLLHITITTLDDNLVSAHIGVIGKNAVHLAILAYSPFYANHSPGKLHLMQLGRQLSEENIELLDLTPGGDLWKERFSNDHDEVYELIIYKNQWEKTLEYVKDEGLTILKKCLMTFSITPDRLKQLFSKIRRINIKSIINILQCFIPSMVEMRIYRYALASSQQFEPKAGRMEKNSIANLLKFYATESWQDKQLFASSVLHRLENGEHCYSFSSNNKLLHYGWLIEEQRDSFISEVQQNYQYPPKSAVLYDFYTSPCARGQGLYQENIKQIILDASMLENVEYIYISVKADNAPSRHVIEKLGFEYQESLFNYKWLGFSKKWKKNNPVATGKGL